eukprot:TRINITY_DN3390_c0_g1_i2.p1 TRINITY_DN3390_c0_g1~~TRINITY_DN3390_c0_g1_i2.p1  ORF type:complete len:213 (+),score=43.87 TRINITY_DN3390_c0_g1_i2:166-804(+)
MQMERRDNEAICTQNRHNSKLVGFCGSKDCKKPRMFCTECLISGHHNNHILILFDKFTKDPSILTSVFLAQDSKDYVPLDPLNDEQFQQGQKAVQDFFDHLKEVVVDHLNQWNVECLNLLKKAKEQRRNLSDMINNFFNFEELLACFNNDKQSNYETFSAIFASLLDTPSNPPAQKAFKDLQVLEAAVKKLTEPSLIRDSFGTIFSLSLIHI